MARHDKNGSQEEPDTDLKVTDRRLFTAEGQLRREADPDTEEAEPDLEPAESEPAPVGKEQESGFERRPVEEPKGVDFTMLINAMAEPVLLFLGEISHPSAGKPTVDLERARIQIDMLDLLRVKCRGNLNSEEEGLLDRILYQLRMLYVARVNQPEQP